MLHLIKLGFTLFAIVHFERRTSTKAMSKRNASSLALSTNNNANDPDAVAADLLSVSTTAASSINSDDPKLSDPSMMLPLSPGTRVKLGLGRGKHRRIRSTSTNRATIPLRSALPLELSLSVSTTDGTSPMTLTMGAGGTDIKRTDADTSVHATTARPKKEAKLAHAQTRQMRSSMLFTIRPLTMKDIAPVYHLGNAIFTANEFPNMYRTWDDFAVVENFEGSPEFCFVAESAKKEIIGFLLGQTMTKSNVGTRGYIQWVAVLEPYRRHGVATSLLRSFTNVAKNENVSFLLADTPADNLPAIQMFQKAGLCRQTDHVYLTRQIPKETKLSHVSEDGTFNYCYTAKKQRIIIRNMEIDDLYPIYLMGENIFTTKSSNLYNFWDEHLVLQSFLSDPNLCAVATVKEPGQDKETVVGFSFGTTIEKPRSSWKYAYLVWLGCSSDYQGLGLASQLYNVMLELFWIEKCRILMIDTQQNNEGALKFFRKLGFGHDEEHVYLSNSNK
jgi:ribosomal protein S18 acetylase RimI-like enzyme